MHQGDHNWSMKNPEILENIYLMRAMEETLVVFSNNMGHNETPCNTASHCDPCCLKMAKEKDIQRSLEISEEMVRLC